MTTEYFTCDCTHAAHVLHVVSDETGEITFSFYLYPHDSIWDRLKVAAQYVVGLGKNWQFDNFLLRKEDMARLLGILSPAAPEEPELTAAKALSKIDSACDGKDGDESCCALVALCKNGYTVEKVNRKQGFDLKLRREV